MSATCIRVRMPCTMHGPEEPGGVVDHGANALSVIASLIDSIEEEMRRSPWRSPTRWALSPAPAAHLRPEVTLKSPPPTEHPEPNDEQHHAQQ